MESLSSRLTSKLNAAAKADQFFNFGGQGDISFIVQDKSIGKTLDKAHLIADELRKKPMFLNIDVAAAPIQPQYVIKINTAKVERAGVSQVDLRRILSIYLAGGKLPNDIMINGQSVPIYMQLSPYYLHNINNLQLLTIRNNNGKVLPITNFIDLQLVAKPTVILTTNNIPRVEVDITLAKSFSISDAIPIIDQVISNKAPGIIYQYVGAVRDYFINNRNALIAFVFGVLMVYLVLALLFNSLLDPFIILFTVPFSLIGGALSLYFINGTVNIVSSIALITLVGLITKHGVLVVQFANAEVSKGKSIKEAVLSSAASRFRPIMMTTLAMVAGALPLIFAVGMGYKMRMQLGVVLATGLLIGTLFSLFIVPLVYLEMKKVAKKGG